MSRWFVLLIAALPLALAGCAGDDGANDAPQPEATENETPSEPAVNETVTHDPITIAVGLTGAYPVNIAYDPARIEVKAGQEVTIRFTNNDQNPGPGHDWVLEGVDGARTDIIGNGETTEVTFTAPAAGEYSFFCSVGNHRDSGMEGAFIVTA